MVCCVGASLNGMAGVAVEQPSAWGQLLSSFCGKVETKNEIFLKMITKFVRDENYDLAVRLLEANVKLKNKESMCVNLHKLHKLKMVEEFSLAYKLYREIIKSKNAKLIECIIKLGEITIEFREPEYLATLMPDLVRAVVDSNETYLLSNIIENTASREEVLEVALSWAAFQSNKKMIKNICRRLYFSVANDQDSWEKAVAKLENAKTEEQKIGAEKDKASAESDIRRCCKTLDSAISSARELQIVRFLRHIRSLFPTASRQIDDFYRQCDYLHRAIERHDFNESNRLLGSIGTAQYIRDQMSTLDYIEDDGARPLDRASRLGFDDIRSSIALFEKYKGVIVRMLSEDKPHARVRVSALLKKSPALAFGARVNEKKNSLLHVAADRNDIELVKLIISIQWQLLYKLNEKDFEHVIKSIYKLNIDKHTPIHLAANGKHKILKHVFMFMPEQQETAGEPVPIV